MPSKNNRDFKRKKKQFWVNQKIRLFISFLICFISGFIIRSFQPFNFYSLSMISFKCKLRRTLELYMKTSFKFSRKLNLWHSSSPSSRLNYQLQVVFLRAWYVYVDTFERSLLRLWCWTSWYFVDVLLW